MPKISICVPTYNRSNLLCYAIESVLKQSFADWELIVCDDGSRDDTPEIMSKYTQDNRIKYIRHQQNIGKSNNMRSGFDAATGDYFIKFDDDDRLVSEFLQLTSAVLDTNPQIDFVGTDHWIIDINNQRDEAQTKYNSQIWGRSTLSEGTIKNLLEVTFVNQSFQIGATLFRKQILSEIGFMQPNWQNCEDNDLFVRLALAEKNAYYLPQLLMEYRCHAEQQSKDRAIRYLADKLEYLQNYHFDDEQVEKVRHQRLIETQLLLGLRLIEKGETKKGRELVFAGKSHSPSKAWTGLGLSLLPTGMRPMAFDAVRKVKG